MVLSDLCVRYGPVLSDQCPIYVRLMSDCVSDHVRKPCPVSVRNGDPAMCMSDKLSPECPTTALLRVAAPSHICLCVHVGENRHGNLGTHSRDGDGDNPLLLVSDTVEGRTVPDR